MDVSGIILNVRGADEWRKNMKSFDGTWVEIHETQKRGRLSEN